jgi:type IV pilus assembly protein PilM
MAKNQILGIDAGVDRLKLALVEDGYVLDAVAVKMPENLVKEGKFTSTELLSELIAKTLKDNGIKAANAAFVMSNSSVYVKNVKMPMMTKEQLVYNLPYEFNDYITGEVKDYVFDYAVLPPDDKDEAEEDKADAPADAAASAEAAEPEADEAKEETLNLMAVGGRRDDIENIGAMLRRAGLKLVKAAPAICAYISLIRQQMDVLSQTTDEFGILDLGYESVRMYMFKGDRHVATRELDIGLSSLDNVIADLYNVEVHLAHTYLLNNFENCLEREECRQAYENIAIELMRAMNFYRFSNPDSSLTDLWLCGGAAAINPLAVAIGEMLDMRLHTASELVMDGEEIPDCNSFVQAIGIAID